jgi:hypothetical protein
MKKIAIIIGALAIFSLGSCTKDWTCTCTDQSNNHTYHDIPDATLIQAKNTCNGFQYDKGAVFNNCSLQ